MEFILANAMPKQTCAEFVVANERLLYIKNFEYSLSRILNCFLRSLKVALYLKPLLRSKSASILNNLVLIILRNLFMRTETRVCGNYSCELGSNSRISSCRKILKINVTIFHISILRLKFGFDILNISETF